MLRMRGAAAAVYSQLRAVLFLRMLQLSREKKAMLFFRLVGMPVFSVWAAAGAQYIKDEQQRMLDAGEIDESSVHLRAFDIIAVLYLSIAFVELCRAVSVGISREKESLVKDAVLVMGLRQSAYWLGWLVFHTLTTLATVVMVSCVVYFCGMFGASSLLVVFSFFFLFLMGATAMCLCVAAVCSTARSAAMATTALFFAAPVLYVPLNMFSVFSGAVGLEYASLALVPYGFLQGILKLTGDDDSPGPGLAAVCGSFVVDTIVYTVLAWHMSISWRDDCSCLGRRSDYEAALSDEDAYDKDDFEGAEPPDTLVELADIHKEFAVKSCLGGAGKKVRPLRGLSISLGRNEVVALLGPNGAGKTTAMSVLTGACRPACGSVTVLGCPDPSDPSVRCRMSVLPQHEVFFEKLTVEEHMEFFASLRSLPDKAPMMDPERLLERMGLADEVNRKKFATELSGGMRRKLCLANALTGSPEVILLDECTTGMDVQSRAQVWSLLRDITPGRAVLMTTHSMDEAVCVADRIAILDRGRLRCCGSQMFLKSRFKIGYRLSLELNGSADVGEIESTVRDHIPGAEFEGMTAGGRVGLGGIATATLALADIPLFPALMRALEENESVLGIGMSTTSLEDIFVKIFEENERADKRGPISAMVPGAGHGTDPEDPAAVPALAESLRSQRRPKPPSAVTQYAAASRHYLKLYLSNLRQTALVVGMPIVLLLLRMLMFGGGGGSDAEKNSQSANLAMMIVFGMVNYVMIVTEKIVRERKARNKHMLLSHGMRRSVYWLGNLTADLVLYYIVALAVTVSCVFMGQPSSLGTPAGHAFLVLAGPALIGYGYLMSCWFEEPESVLRFCMLIMVGKAWLLAMVMIMVMMASTPLARMLNLFYSLFPLWPFVMGMLHLSDFSPLPSASIYLDCSFLVLDAVIIFAFLSWWDTRRAASPPPQRDDAATSPTDVDVIAEERRVSSGADTAESIRAVHLRKSYKGGEVVALDNLSLGIEGSECFGLLGPVGAGKSTFQRLVTMEETPSAGTCHVLCRGVWEWAHDTAHRVGIVLQEDVLHKTLTGYDHIELYASIKGVSSAEVAAMCGLLGPAVELGHDVLAKRVDQYSGGTKRKLVLVLSLIGNPEVLLMDEPTTGVDVIARRSVWELLSSLSPERASILATHSMEEAERLCHRIGILVNGRLSCLGTPQSLKGRFGSDYQLDAKVRDGEIERVTRLVCESLPGPPRVSRTSGTLVTFTLPRQTDQQFRLSRAFELMEAERVSGKVVDYTIAQPSLEQVFLLVAKNQVYT